MTNKVEIRFSAHLKRFVNLPDSFSSEGECVRDIVNDLEQNFPGVAGYLLHENGKLRQHVNLFLDDRMVEDRQGLSDSISGVKTIFVMQALSGG